MQDLQRAAIVAPFAAQLKRAFSDPRLERYQNGGGDLEMLTNYVWNMALADALYCPLSMVEVMLRNAIHGALSNHFGTPNWYDGHGLLEARQEKDLETAKAHIASRHNPITPERVVSNLTFGFWVTLLSKTYNDRFWRANNAANLKHAFPHALGKDRQRKVIMNKFYAANSLRNLAFHHEPIFDLPSLVNDHRRAYDAIAWIDPAMAPTTRFFDRFPDVHQHGKAEVRASIKLFLGIPEPKRRIVPTTIAMRRRRRVRPA